MVSVHFLTFPQLGNFLNLFSLVGIPHGFKDSETKACWEPEKQVHDKNPIPLLRGGEMKWGLIYLEESFNER